MAVKVTLVPAQIFVDEATTFTVGVTGGFTVIVMILLVADVGEAQDALLTMFTFTLSALLNVFVVNVLLLAPVLTPFTCH